MENDFEARLQDFQNWARTASPEFGEQVDKIIASTYISQLGEAAPQSAAATTASKLNDFVTSVGSIYLGSLQAYYQAKGKVADLKLAAQGSWATQAVNTAQGAIAIPPSNLLIFGGLAVVGLVLLTRK